MARVPDVLDYVDDAAEGGNGITCKSCGATGLEWHDTGVRWRLIEPGLKFKFHECRRVASPDEFSVVK